ncbi:MAG: metallophosphoesterase, partial [Spirochaetia bacterium]|nr:metallophosphoesterase [Spirochaetia bacterium]
SFSRDKSSLSYAAEPLPGVVLLCLDTAQWKKNRGFPFRYTPVDGRISGSTFKWAEKILYNAEKTGKEVFALHHHPLDEEFNHYEKIIELYKKYKVQLVITGHRHKYMISYADSLPMLIAPNLSSGPDNTLEIRIEGNKATSTLNPYNFSE